MLIFPDLSVMHAAQRAHKRGLEEGWNAAIDEAARLLDKQQKGGV